MCSWRMNPENPNQAKWQGQWYPLRIVEDTIRVRGETPRQIQRKHSRHGPVFFEDRAPPVRVAIHPAGTWHSGVPRRTSPQPGDPDAHMPRVSQYGSMPPRSSENMICGDVDGNIGWHASALTPRRAGGWDGRLPVPGTGEHSLERFQGRFALRVQPGTGIYSDSQQQHSSRRVTPRRSSSNARPTAGSIA